MSALIETPPYGPRDEGRFVQEMNDLTEHHLRWNPAYQHIVGPWQPVQHAHDLPFVHVGLFKRLSLTTPAPGSRIVRTVLSSSTSGVASRIPVDEDSARLQALSTRAILGDFIGTHTRPLLVLDSAQSLRQRHDFGARVMAAMSLKPFASEVFFLLKDAQDPGSMQTAQVEAALRSGTDLLVYGFSWILWFAWAQRQLPEELATELKRRRIAFVHSGGWKKLEDQQVDRSTFDHALLAGAGPGSQVLDYYGLVEQMGVVFPLCAHGARHVPAWAQVIVRDSWTLAPLADGEGQLQLLNTISRGSPCHSVLTEDMGRLLPQPCPCGRAGITFELLGRVPKAELRGCANV